MESRGRQIRIAFAKSKTVKIPVDLGQRITVPKIVVPKRCLYLYAKAQ